MTWRKRTSRQRLEKSSARAKGAGATKAEPYAGAFERVRLVRAWIAVVAAILAMLSTYVALLERWLAWLSTYPGSAAGIRDWYSVIP